ncbi:predicted protein [Naegleria gruberi]|uniref:Predicted protein n=1 Tax=Naegleria gruberi TaxID=5762 RepID=D2VX45_NAEGR|nr:uncharacterized protein NAEGRDRAFT_73614 [Naegleria gruberi]EFC38560.1 predicted protein [Naegleria gruberi]|eukprot:XP_002671304.1 predicted protein [Naegleria gruberi strain NEG-M]
MSASTLMESSFFSSAKYPMKPYSNDTITQIFGSVAFHTVLFFVFYALSSVIFSTFKTLDFSKKMDWVSRLVSNFHAIVSFCGALYAILTYPCYLTWNFSCYDNGIGELTMRYTIGYFCYDLLLILAFYKKLGSIGMVLHHVFGILGWGLILSYGSFSFVALMFTLTEATTPFVNQRWFLYECKMKETSLYAAFGFLLWLAWSIVRVPLVPLCGYYLYLNYEGLISVLFGSNKKKDIKKND